MNARADNSQSDAVSNKSSGGKVTFCARAQKKKKKTIMSRYSKKREI